MSIRISAIVVLLQPVRIDTGRYSKTTSRALARTKEDGELQFELIFFYDIEYPFNNTIPDAYDDGDVVHFTGGLTEIANEVLHVTVQRAQKLALVDVPQHCVEITLLANVRSVPTTITTSSGKQADNSDADKTQFTMFNVTAPQWVSLPRTENPAAPKGKTVTFDFIVHHPPSHRLSSRTSRLKAMQNITILGLLELIDKKPYIQLTDLSWNSTSVSSHSAPSSSPSPFQQSRWNSDNNNIPHLSATRALAASITATHQSNAIETASPTKKRRRNKSAAKPTIQEESSSAQPQSELQSNPAIQNQTSREQLDSPRWQLRSRNPPNSEQHTQENSQGIDSLLSSAPDRPEITMVGGIPQLRNSSQMQSSRQIRKLRDHCTSVLPIHPFSPI
jgi:hypothetical protein